ncbi:DUF4129 domain-containing protein [Haloarcula litorea]|uniref:DUF4129 domain-containing protein n=1 Tax=Haloarcula litorea TaxID=3032579 RepID=UPI0023E83747|nr:DUF4129 domain-containing protein [Halomicroarcula sp. GDY20]
MTRPAAATLVAVLAVAGLVLAAPALETDPSSGLPSDDGGSSGDGERRGFSSASGVEIPSPLQDAALVAFLLVAAGTVAYVFREFGWGDAAIALTALGIVAFVVNVLGWNATAPGPAVLGGSGGNGTQGGAASAVTTPGTLTLAAVGGTALLATLAAVVLLRSTGHERWPGGERDEGIDEDAVETEETAAVARAAGRAADDIAADADPENAVYRAWHEMTDALDVADPDSATPREFADAAVEAGIDDRHVETLTTLFEAVRYGDRPVTEERAARAEAALRAIEGGES